MASWVTTTQLGFSFRIDIRKEQEPIYVVKKLRFWNRWKVVGRTSNQTTYPPQKGLWGKPTVINNVETFANIPPIFLMDQNGLKILDTNLSRNQGVYFNRECD